MARVTQEHVDSRRKAIVDAALRMFARKGSVGATMQEVADEAGISAGAIYHYFSSKDELLQAVFDRITRRDRELLQEAASGIRSPAEALVNIGRVITESLKSDSVKEETVLVLEQILSECRGATGPCRRREAQETHLAMLEMLVRQAQAAGGLDDTIDPWAFAVILLCCMNGTRVLALELQGSVDMDEVFAALQSVLFRLAPSSSSPKEEEA